MNKKIIGRIVFPFLIGMLCFSSSFGQGCDPQITQMSILHPSFCLGEGNTTDIEITWGMGGIVPTCVAPSGSWQIQINLPASLTYTVSSSADVTAPSDFTWSLSNGYTLTGTSNTDIAWLGEGTVIVNITGNIPNDCSSIISNTNIQIVPSVAGGSPASFDNNTGNDVQSDDLGVDALLPVKFAYLNARSQDCENVDVAWQTQSEINNEGFFIERSIGSTDQFESLGFVESRGNSNAEQNYTFADDVSGFKGNGNLYYRIKQVDLDGRYDYSDVVTVRLDCAEDDVRISIYPNPTINDIYVSISENREVASTIVIVNNLNQIVATLPVDQSGSRTKIDMSEYVAGMYFIKVLDNTNEVLFTEKVLLTK